MSSKTDDISAFFISSSEQRAGEKENNSVSSVLDDGTLEDLELREIALG